MSTEIFGAFVLVLSGVAAWNVISTLAFDISIIRGKASLAMANGEFFLYLAQFFNQGFDRCSIMFVASACSYTFSPSLST
jgi:hypothetical protein